MTTSVAVPFTLLHVTARQLVGGQRGEGGGEGCTIEGESSVGEGGSGAAATRAAAVTSGDERRRLEDWRGWEGGGGSREGEDADE